MPWGERTTVAGTVLDVPVTIHPEVSAALDAGRPVVALESTIISHGLPRPDNLRVAREIEESVRAGGAVPATIAVVDGVPRIGLDDDALRTIADDDGVVKVSVRDLGTLVARRGHGATTVAATAHLAALAGIRVFATGGLETLNIPVLGYRTDRFPGFYLADSGFAVDWSVDDVHAVADVLRARELLRCGGGVLVVNPVAPEDELDRDLHDDVLARGLAAADAAGVRGKDVTPFLLDYFHTATDGRSLAVNVALVRSNAVVAAGIAAALAP